MKTAISYCLLCFPLLLSAQPADNAAVLQIDSLIQIARTFALQEHFENALSANMDAQKVALEQLGRASAAYGNVCFNEGRILYLKGDYREAEKKYLEALAIRGDVLGKEHPDYAKSLSNLGNLYGRMGLYDKVEPLYREAITIQGRILGKEHPEYATSLHALCLYYSYRIGDYEKAEPFCLEAFQTRGKVLGPDHRDYLISLITLANLYFRAGDYEKAGPLYLEAEGILDTYSSDTDHIYAYTLNVMVMWYLGIGNYNKAESALRKAKAIQEKVQDHDHPEHALSLFQLAELYRYTGDYPKAEQYYLEAKAIQEKVLGQTSEDYTSTLIGLALLLEKQNRYAASEPLWESYFELIQHRLSQSAGYLSVREMANYTALYQNSGNDLLSCLLARPAKKQRDNLAALNYNHALFQKGFLLTAANRLNALASISPETEEQYNELKACRRRLAAEYANPVPGHADKIDLEKEADVLEKDLARKIAGYAEATRQLRWQEVQSELKMGEAAVEFVRFRFGFPEKTDSMIYAALLIYPGAPAPEFIPLFEEKQLEQLLKTGGEVRRADYVNAVYAPGPGKTGNARTSLYKLVWQPLENAIKASPGPRVSTIYFSPAGLLHRLNIGAIPYDDNGVLADRYYLVQLKSTRQLAIPDRSKPGVNDALLFGGIQFDTDAVTDGAVPSDAGTRGLSLSFAQTDTALRSAYPFLQPLMGKDAVQPGQNADRGGGTWRYLPGTEREIDSLKNVLTAAGVSVDVKKGLSASEEAFKALGQGRAPSPRILHLATHGYFFPDPKNARGSQGTNQDEPVFKNSEHPMLRSGLILAGGNAAWQGVKSVEDREDGVLTAYEISQINLSNTELVVLSACETGLGAINGNEGVYGLQRAFKIAGAKYIIMSLWEVPDRETQELMTVFYQNWLEHNMSIPDAFHSAQQEMKARHLNPYLWAGFVLVK